MRGAIDAKLAALLGPGWAGPRSFSSPGHRRENFGEGFDEICDAIARLARAFPDHRFVYPVHLNPQRQGSCESAARCTAERAVDSPSGVQEFRRADVAMPAGADRFRRRPGGSAVVGKPVLVMRDTTERPEGIAAGTALLTGANADAIVLHATRLLTDSRAYETMVAAQNPYGDGHAAGRIVDGIRKYFSGCLMRFTEGGTCRRSGLVVRTIVRSRGCIK